MVILILFTWNFLLQVMMEVIKKTVTLKLNICLIVLKNFYSTKNVLDLDHIFFWYNIKTCQIKFHKKVYFRKWLQISGWYRNFAFCLHYSHVRPHTSLACGSAPALKSICKEAICPALTAQCRGVVLEFLSTSRPSFCRRN